MTPSPFTWSNRSPGNLAVELPPVTTSDAGTAVRTARNSSEDWAANPLEERILALKKCQTGLREASESLALRMALETGKPLVEARGEMGAVLAKFDLTFADALAHISERAVSDGPHPASVRRRPRGPAAVIAPFNFPIHLGHGAAVAYLLAGNPVLFKPSPMAAVTGAEYGAIMAAHLPPGVFQIVQGGGETGRALCLHPDVRAVCFTGSIPVGTSLARELASDYSKSLSLELGGKNAALICADADLPLAAAAVADALCLTAGQRCNATSRVFIDASALDPWLDLLRAELRRYVPGDPLNEATRLGPVINAEAVKRYNSLTALRVGDWIVPGFAPGKCEELEGHYVNPAIVLCRDFARLADSPLQLSEAFCPILSVTPVQSESEMIGWHNSTPFGLTASVFTRDPGKFRRIGDALPVGNLYWNLPTTFSPSTLPFGGHGISGNGHPGGRGFIRFAGEEQALQWRAVDTRA